MSCNGAAYQGVSNSGNSQVLTWNPVFLTAPDGSTALLQTTSIDISIFDDADGSLLWSADQTRGQHPGSVTCSVDAHAGGEHIVGTFTGELIHTSH